MPVKLESRIPEIMAELPLRTTEAIAKGTEGIARLAEERVRSQGLVRSGALADSLEVRPGEGGSWGVWLVWYYRYAEFGTVNEAARPFLIPATEEGAAKLVSEVSASLKDL